MLCPISLRARRTRRTGETRRPEKRGAEEKALPLGRSATSHFFFIVSHSPSLPPVLNKHHHQPPHRLLSG